ncbi:MAG: peptidase C39 [Bacillota bacterium]|nr:peptidase C39 [Bacillota bacterium]
MKNPLHYQLSEFDCGPTAMLDAVSFLFPREAIPPEVIRNIMLYCLDCYGSEGAFGKKGTSRIAMMFLSNWLEGYGKVGQLPVSSRYLSGRSVYLGNGSIISDALHHGGVAVVRVFYDEGHYVLLTGEEDGNIYMFDPYYRTVPYEEEDILIEEDHPCAYNRILPLDYFNKEALEIYAFGPVEEREAVLIFNRETMLTQEETIEYYI